MHVRSRERGAAAVEFALVAPILIALVLGIAVFSRAYQVQSSLSMAAREGARVMALEQDNTAAETRAEEAASELGVPGTDASALACAIDDSGTETTTVTVSYTFDFIGVTIPMTGQGVMRCGG